MRGPALQTIGPSGIQEFPIELLRVQIRHGDPRPAGQQEKIDSGHSAKLRCPPRGEPPQLEKLQGDEEFHLLDELFLRLSGVKEDTFRKIDVNDSHRVPPSPPTLAPHSAASAHPLPYSAISAAARFLRNRSAKRAPRMPRT